MGWSMDPDPCFVYVPNMATVNMATVNCEKAPDYNIRLLAIDKTFTKIIRKLIYIPRSYKSRPNILPLTSYACDTLKRQG